MSNNSYFIQFLINEFTNVSTHTTHRLGLMYEVVQVSHDTSHWVSEMSEVKQLLLHTIHHVWVVKCINSHHTRGGLNIWSQTCLTWHLSYMTWQIHQLVQHAGRPACMKSHKYHMILVSCDTRYLRFSNETCLNSHTVWNRFHSGNLNQIFVRIIFVRASVLTILQLVDSFGNIGIGLGDIITKAGS